MPFCEVNFFGGVIKITDFNYIFEKMKPQSKKEQEVIKKLVAELGEFASVKEVAKTLKVSKTYIYQMIEQENIIFVEAGRRKIIYTRSLLVILR